MNAYCPPIPSQCSWADGASDVFLPLSKPLRQSHPALLGQVNALINANVLSELSSQFLLDISVEILEDRIPVVLMAHHEATRPAAVFPFPNHAVPVRPALCYILHLTIFL